jgi:ribosomal protein L11 methyltransferase
MKNKTLLQVSVSTAIEAEDAVAELLGRIFARSPVAYFDEATRKTAVSVYCEHQDEWNPARRAALRDGLREIRSGGLEVGPGTVAARRVVREDWAESWKRHFKPIAIGGRLLVKPSWVKRRARKGQVTVVLDPGLSFGTGNHPTTGFCLRQLVTYRKPGKPQSFWDAGTGSGILAIAAAKLGYSPIKAIDFDPEAVRVAQANARLNGVLDRVRLRRQDITRLSATGRETYDLICANLISDLLLDQRERILRRLGRGGILIVAGILRKEFAEVRRAYAQGGLRLLGSEADGEWESGAFGFAKQIRAC